RLPGGGGRRWHADRWCRPGAPRSCQWEHLGEARRATSARPGQRRGAAVGPRPGGPDRRGDGRGAVPRLARPVVPGLPGEVQLPDSAGGADAGMTSSPLTGSSGIPATHDSPSAAGGATGQSGVRGAVEIATALDQPPPTAEQVAVIEAPLEPTLVVAGAGSGKTETMAARVVWLVVNGFVRPEEVLGLTFTRKAAIELGE